MHETHRWREMDSNFRFPNRSAPVFEQAVPSPTSGLTVSRPGTKGSNPSPSSRESRANLTSSRRRCQRQTVDSPTVLRSRRDATSGAGTAQQATRSGGGGRHARLRRHRARLHHMARSSRTVDPARQPLQGNGNHPFATGYQAFDAYHGTHLAGCPRRPEFGYALPFADALELALFRLRAGI